MCSVTSTCFLENRAGFLTAGFAGTAAIAATAAVGVGIAAALAAAAGSDVESDISEEQQPEPGTRQCKAMHWKVPSHVVVAL